MIKPAAIVALSGLLGLAALLAGCQQVGKLPFVYRLDVQQGNVLDEEMLARLKKGMSKKQVRFILGTPLLADTFNEERWDYFYSFRRAGGQRVQRHISLYFKDDGLDRIEGDVEARLGDPPEPRRRERMVEVPKFEREEGFLAELIPEFMKEESEKRVVVERAEDGTPIGVKEEEGFMAALTPSFFKDDKPVEKALAEQAGAAPARAGTGTAATTATSAKAPAPAELAQPDIRQEEAFLTNLLSDYGRGDAAATAARKAAPASSVAAPPDASSKAEQEEAGFFKTMVERYKTWEQESAADAASRDIPLPDSNPGQSEN